MSNEEVPTREAIVAATQEGLKKLIDSSKTKATAKPILLAWIDGLRAPAEAGGDELLKRAQKYLTENALPEEPVAPSAGEVKRGPLTQMELDQASRAVKDRHAGA